MSRCAHSRMHAYRHPTSSSSNATSNSSPEQKSILELRSMADRSVGPTVFSDRQGSVGPTGSAADREVQRPTGSVGLRVSGRQEGRPHDDRADGRGRRLFRRHQSSPANTTGTRRFLQFSGKKLRALAWDMITKAARPGLGYDNRRMAGNALRSSHQFAGEPNHGQFTGFSYK